MRRRTSALLLCLLVVGCEPITTVVVDPTSTAASLRFRVFFDDSARGDPGFWQLQVYRCPNSALAPAATVWGIHRRGFDLRRRLGLASPEVRYGVLPSSAWSADTGPSPISAGAYAVLAEGQGLGSEEQFAVDSAGRVRVLSSDRACGHN